LNCRGHCLHFFPRQKVAVFAGLEVFGDDLADEVEGFAGGSVLVVFML
jgi:hypothetical protein